MIKEDKYFRCGKQDHFIIDIEVLYKDQAIKPDQQLVVNLKAIKLGATFHNYELNLEN